jgi:hypothetical protein
MSEKDAAFRSEPWTGWMPLRAAAWRLGMSPGSLRKALERRAKRTPDGGIEAELDGLRARKLANRWLVSLGPYWARNERD